MSKVFKEYLFSPRHECVVAIKLNCTSREGRPKNS